MNKVILWDLDGTLIDSEPVHALAFYAAIKDLRLKLPCGFYDELLGVSGSEVYSKLVEATGLQLGLDEWSDLKLKHFGSFSQRIRPITGIPELLRKLSLYGILMAVVSNSSRTEVDLSLNGSSFRDNFQFTISRSDVAQGKPAPDGYLLAASRLNQRPQNCLVIEDSRTGAAAGHAAGMNVIYHPQAPDLDPSLCIQYLPPCATLLPLIETFLISEDLSYE